MRKKSHISLAKYIVGSTSDEELKRHKLSFYIGSILPDCIPSFVYKRHEMEGTYPEVKRSIDKLINGKKNKPVKNKRRYYVNLGQVTHYIADYFTYPHNKIYPGTIKDHCSYEEQLKRDLREFLKTKAADELHTEKIDFKTPEALYNYIQEKHDDYLDRQLNVKEDIQHIVTVNHYLVEGIHDLFYQTKEYRRLRSS